MSKQKGALALTSIYVDIHVVNLVVIGYFTLEMLTENLFSAYMYSYATMLHVDLTTFMSVNIYSKNLHLNLLLHLNQKGKRQAASKKPLLRQHLS